MTERARGGESLAALAVLTLAAVVINAKILRSDVVSRDSLVHQYWMWHFRDPQFFNDGLTAELRESSRYPYGYQALFWLPSQVFDPISFGEWVGVALMAVSGWLIFGIVREHASWRPAPWIAAGVFVALVDVHRFFGGFPRAFVQPVVLLTVLLLLKRRDLAAALVAAGGALLYPPASILAVGILIVSALRWSDRRPQLDARRASFAVLALVIMIVAILGPRLAAGGAPRVFTATEARTFPEFGPHGALHFFADSTVEYLRQNRSGFDLRASGSILALAALALLLVRRGNVRLLRAEVLAMPVVALGAYAVAQAVLFKLYLPHRYTYPLVAFFAIVVGVTIHPTWTSLWARPRPRLRAFAVLCAPVAIAGFAVHIFPLGPSRSMAGFPSMTTAAIAGATVVLAAAVALLLRRAPRAIVPAVGAALTGVTLLGALVFNSEGLVRDFRSCPKRPVTEYLASLPKDAVIAGDTSDLTCLPMTTRRAVVISTKLALTYEVDYFFKARARMFATLRAYYGPSADAIVDLRRRYGATHLWVRRDALQRILDGGRWGRRNKPYGPFVRRLVSTGQPAVLHLPPSCRTWKQRYAEVYDIRCIGAHRTNEQRASSSPAHKRG